MYSHPSSYPSIIPAQDGSHPLPQPLQPPQPSLPSIPSQPPQPSQSRSTPLRHSIPRQVPIPQPPPHLFHEGTDPRRSSVASGSGPVPVLGSFPAGQLNATHPSSGCSPNPQRPSAQTAGGVTLVSSLPPTPTARSGSAPLHSYPHADPHPQVFENRRADVDPTSTSTSTSHSHLSNPNSSLSPNFSLPHHHQPYNQYRHFGPPPSDQDARSDSSQGQEQFRFPHFDPSSNPSSNHPHEHPSPQRFASSRSLTLRSKPSPQASAQTSPTGSAADHRTDSALNQSLLPRPPPTTEPVLSSGSQPEGYYPTHHPPPPGGHQRIMPQPSVTIAQPHQFPNFQQQQQQQQQQHPQAYTSPTHYNSPLSPSGKSTSTYNGHTTSTDTVVQSPEGVNEAVRPPTFELPSQLNCANNGPNMVSTATFQQPFYGAALHISRQEWSPFGYSQFYPPPTAALGLGLEMATGVKQHTDFQAPMNNLMPMMSSFNPSFRLPETYGFQGSQPRPPGSSTSSQSMNLQAISPNLLRSDQELSTTEPPASPLQSVSGDGDELSDSDSELNIVKAVRSRRIKSDGDFGLGLVDADMMSESSDEGDDGVRTSKRRRQLKWSSGSDIRRYEREAKEREVVKQKEMVEFELGPTKGNKRERRRMQNRLAQRAFRARSKIQSKEVVNHMSRLETLTEAQAERIGTLTELVERLQRENTSLKQARWSSSFAEFNGYDRSAGSETNNSTAQVSPNSTLVDRAEGKPGRQ